jgi:ankyrin repeat protein
MLHFVAIPLLTNRYRFLLAQIYLNSLEDKLTAKDIRSALQYFLKQKPGSSEDQKLQVLSKAYELSLERINSQRPGFRELAHKVLYWITCAKRPLTKIELQHALAVEIETSHLDVEAFTQVEKMVSVCAGLVTVDEDSGIIRLVHYTTQEYFDGIMSDRFANAEADIANTCIAYLSFECFATGICTTDQDLKQRLALYPLYNYAARNWGFHASMAPIEKIPSVITLLQKEANVLAAAQVMMIGQPYSGATRHSQRKGKQITGPHLAAYFGLRDAMAKIIANGQPPDEKDGYGQTPLSYASERGHEAVVKLLLEIPGVECRQADEDGRSPLSYAAENGHTAVVQLLLRAPSCGINNWDIDGRTPLSYAAAQGHAAIVEMLCDVTSVNADICHLFGRTPLSFACEGGHESVVEIILTHVHRGSMINDGDADNRTPLSYSAQKGHEGVVRLLLQVDKIDPEIRDRESRSPFSYAAEEGHLGVINALLATSVVNANSRQRDGRMPLLYAARRGHTAIVNRLLQIYNVEVDPRDRDGRTPLSYAAEEGHVDVVRLLLAKDGVDVHSTDRKGGTPLSYAEERRQVVTVGLLSR